MTKIWLIICTVSSVYVLTDVFVGVDNIEDMWVVKGMWVLCVEAGSYD